MNESDLLKKLHAPIECKWRLQSLKFGRANCVAYIDARDVMQRLDEVFGVFGWQREHKQIKNNIYCGIGVFDKDFNEWRWVWDTGSESNVEKEKGEASDSFKRAAVNLGIGRFLYDIPIVTLPTAKKVSGGKEKEYPSKKKNVAGDILWSGDDLTKYINANFKELTKLDLGVDRGNYMSKEIFNTKQVRDAINNYLRQGKTPKEIIKFIQAKFTSGIDKEVKNKILALKTPAKTTT